MALIRFLGNFPARASAECFERDRCGDKDRVFLCKVQIQLFDLPDAVRRSRFGIVGGVGGVDDRAAHGRGDDLVLPVSVFAVVVMRDHDLRTQLSKISDQRTLHVGEPEILFVFFFVLDRDIGKPRHNGIGS